MVGRGGQLIRHHRSCAGGVMGMRSSWSEDEGLRESIGGQAGGLHGVALVVLYLTKGDRCCSDRAFV